MQQNTELGPLISLDKLINNEGFIKRKEILELINSKYDMFEVDFNKKTEVKLMLSPATRRCNSGIVPWEVYGLTPIVVKGEGSVGGRRKKKTRKNRVKRRKNKSKSLRKKK